MELANSYNYSECPEEFNCSVHRDVASFSIGPVPSYASLVSSSLSCLGSVLVVLAFLMLPEIRTGAQKLITLLSIADFFTALGYFIAGINFLHHYRPLQADEGSSRNCGTFVAVCRIQSFITTTSSLCSFLWTMLLAVYFHVVIVNKQAVVFGKKMFALMNIISWGVPLIITVPLLATHHLGYSPLGTSNWCFIRDSQRYPINRSLLTLLVLVAGKFWEILSYIVVTILYISISISIYRSRRKLTLAHTGTRITQDRIEIRLLSIPLVFLLLRLWGTVQFFYVMPHTRTSHIQQCIPKQVHRILVPLGIMQAIGDSGQGWSNALLYIFLSPTIRKWFICECIAGCCYRMRSIYRLCGLEQEMSGYSRFSQNHSKTNSENVTSEALNGNTGYRNGYERAALNRNKTSSADNSYGAVINTEGKPSSSRGEYDHDMARGGGKKKGKGELVETASLNTARLINGDNPTT